MKTIGICIGASTITLAAVTGTPQGPEITDSRSISHEGNPRQVLADIFNEPEIRSAARIAVTGRKLRHLLKATTLSEPEALEVAYSHYSAQGNRAQVVVSAGGETFMVYRLDPVGRIIDVYTGNKCASGTGEFFLQQLKRMDLTVEEAVAVADRKNSYKVAGRCSVFCKSDCTHALNKGASKESVVAGLCEMMAGKITELLKSVDEQHVMVVGGSSANSVMIGFLQDSGLNVVVPEHGRCAEALGAALWAQENETEAIDFETALFSNADQGFTYLSPLKDHAHRVSFKSPERGTARSGDVCIVGLDVGSTTTKAVLMRKEDRMILASCYLRTNGDPIGASRRCYAAITEQVSVPVTVVGLGVTGSGRQIAGLHALTPAVINEIIAHATAAAYFDPEVDTLFEIGGQDAKYTYLTNGVPSDYAMNEACSAGTGSFLEEAAMESLNLATEDIGNYAMGGSRPPNFNDQCAAFIGSDIKTAIQSGLEKHDIAAGLVYSICMNYMNRVKGNRAMGRKIFMQGGVCYNQAVPVAMAALTGKEIIVPPEPGLMGAYGVALEVRNKLALGILEVMDFNLEELSCREVAYQKPFVCKGGKEACDRKCSISMIRIKEQVYPFGGACNKYYNQLRHQPEVDVTSLDLVALREKMIFETYGTEWPAVPTAAAGKTVGINNSLMTNNLFPLYHGFFKSLGYQVLLSDAVDPEGCERRGAAFCYPVELAHGTLQNLLDKKPDFLFMPHIKAMPVPGGDPARVTCPFVQAEPYYLKSAFDALQALTVLSPVLDFSTGYEAGRQEFIDMAKTLGHDGASGAMAFENGLQAQSALLEAFRRTGAQVLLELEADPTQNAVVLFGRPYNAFCRLGNMGIPRKFASRAFRIIPQDFLPLEPESSQNNMYWAMGQTILKAARFTQRHPQLFGAYVTNFSCGPDSFLLNYFRDIMGSKPSLTLELDSHSADAGIDTRIEAFIDVMGSYLEINRNALPFVKPPFKAAKVTMEGGEAVVVDSDGVRLSLKSPRVRVLLPSMGDLGSRVLAATLRHVGVQSEALPAPAEKELQLGRGYASCKECLPLILTVGSLIRYVEEVWDRQEVLVYFMPETSGPCRFGQYTIMMQELIEKMALPNIALLSLTSENSYAGFGTRFALRAWQSVILSDVMEEIYSAVIALAVEPESALAVYRQVEEALCLSVERDSWNGLKSTLKQAAATLQSIPRKGELKELPSIALIGEIYVRRDSFSRKNLVERLSTNGFWVRTAPIAEWLQYCDYIVKNSLVVKSRWQDRVRVTIQQFFKNPYETKIKAILGESGFYIPHTVDVAHMIESVQSLVSPRLTGETILTVGAALTEMVETVDGVLALGPFGCMPARISEAIITERLNERKSAIALEQELVDKVMVHHPALPFLSIETDGSAFPQVIESRLESFCLQVGRVHETVKKVRREIG